MIISYEIEDRFVLTEEVISDKIQDLNKVIIQVPLFSINSTNSYLDIISDLLDASYVIEYLANKFDCTSLEKKWDIKHYPVYHLQIESFDANELAKEIVKTKWIFNCPDEDDEDDEEQEIATKIREDIYLYEDEILERKLHYPEIIDDYHANLVNGAYYEMELDSISEDLKKYSERWYGYWASAKYNRYKHKVLLSMNAWIIPKEIKLSDVFSGFGYDKEFSLLDAKLLMIENHAVAFAEGLTLSIPMGGLMQAIECIEECLREKNEYNQRINWDGQFFCHSPKTRMLLSKYPSDYSKAQADVGMYISEFSDFFITTTEHASIVLFDVDKLSRSDTENYISVANQLVSSIEDEVLINADVNIPWERFNDETFEQICYDIIYHNTKYDRSTIRKMGKSRSRDGGRDIVVQARSRFGEKPKKYIFQCKLLKSDSSLSTSNIGSISDVIDQYGADGYGVMCCSYIDSTLYDRLDGIAESRAIDIETWSKFEIERFLARRPFLKERYLGSIDS